MTFVLPTLPALSTRELLQRDGAQAAALQLLTLHPVEITESLEALSAEDRLHVVKALPINTAAQVLLNADAEFRAALLAQLNAHALAMMLAQIPAESAAQLLGQADPARQTAILAATTPTDAARLEAVRRCAPSSVGRLLVRSVPRIQPEMSVAETFRYLRRASAELETVNTLYVLDNKGVLEGVLSLRDLVEAEPHSRIRDLMQPRVIMVTPETDREEAAHLISRYNLLALPVVNHNRVFLGVVTVDDLMDVLIQENTEDVLQLGGVSRTGDAETDSAYWAGRVGSVVGKRIRWLLLIFAAQLATCGVMSWFAARWGQAASLITFVPLLLGMAGSCGSQTVTTVVRGLAVGEIRTSDALRFLRRECLAGLMLGLVLGAAGLAAAAAWGLGWPSTAVVGTSLVVVCVWANAVACLMPLLAKRYRLDPGIASAPLVTAVVDASGLLLYFMIARAWMRF